MPTHSRLDDAAEFAAVTRPTPASEVPHKRWWVKEIAAPRRKTSRVRANTAVWILYLQCRSCGFGSAGRALPVLCRLYWQSQPRPL